jgi:hypothetical protein
VERFSRLRLGWVAALVTALVVIAIAAVGAGVSRAGTSTPTAESTTAGPNAYPRRITICHRSGRVLRRSRYRTIRIPPRSRRAHLRHGDGIGACSRARFTICHRFRRGGKVGRRTATVRGWKAHRRHMRHGDRIRACPRKRR